MVPFHPHGRGNLPPWVRTTPGSAPQTHRARQDSVSRRCRAEAWEEKTGGYSGNCWHWHDGDDGSISWPLPDTFSVLPTSDPGTDRTKMLEQGHKQRRYTSFPHPRDTRPELPTALLAAKLAGKQFASPRSCVGETQAERVTRTKRFVKLVFSEHNSFGSRKEQGPSVVSDKHHSGGEQRNHLA